MVWEIGDLGVWGFGGFGCGFCWFEVLGFRGFGFRCLGLWLGDLEVWGFGIEAWGVGREGPRVSGPLRGIGRLNP